MPYLKIQTNQALDESDQQRLMVAASTLVAQQLGKSERCVMVAIDAARPMMFAGATSPLAYLELKSIGLSEHTTAELSKHLCTLVTEQLNIAPDRIYIEFANAQRHMWGWDGGTF
ncbi:MAG: hypothetical protein GXP17_01185 [Gammaproteobacteria bacterium]|nr:hypothetical protein [Gammaproteobacteria bacterium]